MWPATTVGISQGSSRPTRSTPRPRRPGRFSASATIRPSRNCDATPTVTQTQVLRAGRPEHRISPQVGVLAKTDEARRRRAQQVVALEAQPDA